MDSSRLFPAIKLSWKINFCILCKLKICHYVPASWFVFCSVYCFPSSLPPHQPPLPVSIRLLVFLCLQLLFSLLTRLSSLVWIPSVSASSFLVSLVRRQTRGSLTKLAVVKMQLRSRNQQQLRAIEHLLSQLKRSVSVRAAPHNIVWAENAASINPVRRLSEYMNRVNIVFKTGS